MRAVILSIAMAGALLPAQAQFLSREALGGAALGGLVGGIIGHNHGRQTAEGAAIGAGAGLLLGAIHHNAHRDAGYYGYGHYVYDAGYHPGGPVYYYSYAEPVPVYVRPSRPHYGVTGAVLGGIAGGVIGHNSGRQTAEGAAIGAGAGLILGTLAEHNARRQAQQRQYYHPYQQVQSVPVYQPQPQPAPAADAGTAAQPAGTSAARQQSLIQTPVNRQPASPMSSANSLFGR